MTILARVLTAVAIATVVSAATAQTTEIVSLNTAGAQGDHHSLHPSISADGRYVSFRSLATNFVDIDGDGVIDLDANGGVDDIFVRDRDTGATETISVNSAGIQGDSLSFEPRISADGRYVAFTSLATNLVDIDGDGIIDADANGTVADIFVHDRDTGLTEIVSVNTAGVQADRDSRSPSISADGRFVAFYSYSRNLVDIDGDGSNDPDANGKHADVFVRDRATGKTEIVSVNSAGVQADRSNFLPSISADGRYVAFHSSATNLVDIDGDGTIDADANSTFDDVFVRDRDTGVTEIVSVNSAGVQGNFYNALPSISADGRYVAFRSGSTNLVDIDGDGTIDADVNGFVSDTFVHDRDTGVTEIVSVNSAGVQGNSWSYEPVISADGRNVAFYSRSANLVDIDGDGTIDADTNGSSYDVFLRDRDAGTTEIVSVNNAGAQANNHSWNPSLSADGRYVTFWTQATNLVDIDGDGTIDTDANYIAADVFVRDRGALNAPPVADAGGPYTVAEGSSVGLDGSGSHDDDGDPLTYEWDLDYDGATFDVDAAGATPTFDAAGLDGPSAVTVALRVSDGKGGEAVATANVGVENVPPVLGEITAPVDPVPIGTSITASASFDDAGVPDTHTASWDWGDGMVTPGSVLEAGGSGAVTDDHTYATPGIYTLELTVTDDDGGSDTAVFQYVVVYDPDGSFVTGGGTIDSPAGAYPADPSLVGKASFGFVSKYKKGATVPTGHTEFQFHAAGLDFKSSDYQWLVVAGARAQFKGTGQIKGLPGSYGFMLTAIDGAVNGGGGSDKFRIKIWEAGDDSAVVYDNQIGAADDADPSTTLRSGSIVIHSKKGKS